MLLNFLPRTLSFSFFDPCLSASTLLDMFSTPACELIHVSVAFFSANSCLLSRCNSTANEGKSLYYLPLIRL